MPWDVELTHEFHEWLVSLTLAEQESIGERIDVLEAKGPLLGRPYADTLKGSKVPNLKELRVQHAGKPYRILFVFDPNQTAILLLGGVKSGKSWYGSMIAAAEKLYEEYLEELRKEGRL